jgi:uncharacterized protein (TIGR02270 family)
MILEHIVAQHAEDAAFLWHLRNHAVCAPHYNLQDLDGFDERLHAHLEGLLIAGETGWTLCEMQLSAEEPGAMFAAMVLALKAKHEQRIEQLVSLAEAVPAMRPGFVSACGWVSAQILQDLTKDWLVSPSLWRRWIGITCCAIHRVDPEQALTAAINDADGTVRARALRAAGEFGRRDVLHECQRHLTEGSEACRFWAAWSAVLLGDRREALRALETFCVSSNPFRERALQVRAMELREAHELLKTLEQNPASERYKIQGAGIAGDPSSVPWLIEQMEEPILARVAGESFTFITGVDIAYQNLKTIRPEGFESGPTEDPHDDNVEMDPDDDLPWPDYQKVQAWWDTNKRSFQDSKRYFMGEPLSERHCKKILRDGYQRQRIAAALYLSLMQPGTPLFECRAPAWRQQRWLAESSQ